MKATFAERVIIQTVVSGEWEIDPEGRIWRLAVRHGNRWRPGTYRLAPCSRRRVERPDKKSGYLTVRLMVEGKRHLCGAHRLVWQHVKGDIEGDETEVNHKNGQKHDNRPGNLELATGSENVKHAYRTGLRDEHGERNPAAKLTDHQVAEIRLAYAEGGFTMFNLAARYGVRFQHISRLIRGERRPREPGPREAVDHRYSTCERDPVTGRFLPPDPMQFPRSAP